MTDEELEAEFAKAWAEHPYSQFRAAVLELRDAVYEAVGIARLVEWLMEWLSRKMRGDSDA